MLDLCIAIQVLFVLDMKTQLHFFRNLDGVHNIVCDSFMLFTGYMTAIEERIIVNLSWSLTVMLTCQNSWKNIELTECLYWISACHHVGATFLIRNKSPKARFSLLLNHSLRTACHNLSAALWAATCSRWASLHRHPTALPPTQKTKA